MASLMPQGKQQYFDANGDPLSGGKVHTFAAGTDTPLSTYTTAAGNVANANPVILDSRGEASIFWGAESYKVVLKDSADTEIWTQDNLSASGSYQEIGTYALLRAYNGGTVAFYVRGVTNVFDGGAGMFRVDPSDTTSADDGGTILVDVLGRRWKREFTGAINVKWFGAKGDYDIGSNSGTDDRAAIQAALDAAGVSTATFVSAPVSDVLLPPGKYKTLGTLYIPIGVRMHGPWHSETTNRSVAMLAPRFAGDCIRFKFNAAGSRKFYFGALENFHIYHDNTQLSGWGISFRDSTGAEIAPADSTLVKDVTVRRAPSGGMEIPDGALPFPVVRCRFLFNNGPGIHITGGVNLHQAIHLDGISGDGNNGGLIKLSSLDDHGNVLITNVKSENRVNAEYGNAEHQANVIVLDNCSSESVVTVVGGTHISSIPDGGVFKKPGDFITVSGNTPHLEWSGVQIRVRGTDTGADPNIVSGVGSAVHYSVKSGSLSNTPRVDRTTLNTSYRVFGTVDSYKSVSVEGPGQQIAGTTPGYSLYESDAAADSKMWLMVASGGIFSIRAVNDNGTLGGILAQFTRTQMHIGKDSSGTYLRINGTNATAATGGAATALPAQPQGYITVNINGTDRKIPYYAA